MNNYKDLFVVMSVFVVVFWLIIGPILYLSRKEENLQRTYTLRQKSQFVADCQSMKGVFLIKEVDIYVRDRSMTCVMTNIWEETTRITEDLYDRHN